MGLGFRVSQKPFLKHFKAKEKVNKISNSFWIASKQYKYLIVSKTELGSPISNLTLI
jgi:hypothetical protein